MKYIILLIIITGVISFQIYILTRSSQKAAEKYFRSDAEKDGKSHKN